MKASTLFIATAAAAAMTASLAAQAQREQQQQPRPGERQVDRPGERERMPERRPGERPTMIMHHVDDIHGKQVTNYDRENLGSIETLIADARGQVHYGVVSVGGFLGIADSLIAVPWEAFELRPLYDGLVLNMTRSQLEAAPQFDRGEWPNFGDQRWSDEVHRYYGTTPGHRPGMQRETPGWQDERAPDQQPGAAQQQPQPGQQPQVDRQPGVGAQQFFIRTRDLIGTNVENFQGETIGTLNDIAMAVHEGTFEFSVIGTGGFLGLWQTNVAMPWQALQVTQVDEADYRIVVDVTQERLERVPEYDRDKWPEQRDVEWARDLHRTPAREPARQPAQPRR